MRFEPESSRANKSKIFAFNTFNISSAAAPSSPKNRKQMKFFLIRTRRWFALLHLPSSSSWSKSKERHSHRAGERSHSTSATVKCAQTESSKRMQWNEARQHGKKKTGEKRRRQEKRYIKGERLRRSDQADDREREAAARRSFMRKYFFWNLIMSFLCELSFADNYYCSLAQRLVEWVNLISRRTTTDEMDTWSNRRRKREKKTNNQNIQMNSNKMLIQYLVFTTQ